MTIFKVPCNWDYHLLDSLDPSASPILFGTLASTIVGGGRPSAALPQPQLKEAENYIREAQAKGFRFNYLYNAPCLDSLEFTDTWRKKFLKDIDWLISMGILDVTVTIPYLIEVIKKHVPGMKITVSSYARINSLQRALFFEELGADDLTLDPVSMTRNFTILRAITEKLECKITLIANGFCLYQCPFAEYHCLLMGHNSQIDHPCNGYYEEYPFYHCTLKKLKNPIEIIKAAFIRPEDISEYERLGIAQFKLVDRTRPTDWILNSLKAYLNRSYSGDLLKIINFPHAFLTYLARKSGNGTYIGFPQVDNALLNGLADHFHSVNCAETDCRDCMICSVYADKAIFLPPETKHLTDMLKTYCTNLNFG